MTWLENDQDLVAEIGVRVGLRDPNKRALSAIVENIGAEDFREVVCDLATGVGKTYITAGLVEYLFAKGVRNVLIMTPGKVVLEKTVGNFTPGHAKYIPNLEVQPLVVTRENFQRSEVGDALHNPNTLKIYIFNVHQLLKPNVKDNRATFEVNEFIGTGLYAHLQAADDLVVIADEHHTYHEQAAKFSKAVRDLSPRALVGLTATPAEADLGKVIFHYPLADAIVDEYVKIPTLAYRLNGHASVDLQLADACAVRDAKELVYLDYAAQEDLPARKPLLLVVCASISEATEYTRKLVSEHFGGDQSAVLCVTSESSDAEMLALESVERPDSPVKAVVSVSKLKEGWDVKTVAVVMVTRKLASETLTEQIMGRGLRLPFGRRVGIPLIDQLDIIDHQSYKRLLAQKNLLLEQLIPDEEVRNHVREEGETEHGETDSSPAGLVLPDDEVHSLSSTGTGAGDPVAGPEGIAFSWSPAATGGGNEGTVMDPSEVLLIQEIGQRVQQAQKPTHMYRDTKFKEIYFPAQRTEIAPAAFSLSAVNSGQAFSVGAKYTQEVSDRLTRKALEASRDLLGTVYIQEVQQDYLEGYQEKVPVSEVRSEVIARLRKKDLFVGTTAEKNALNRLVDQFLLGAGVGKDQDTIEWGVNRTVMAVNGLLRLIDESYAKQTSVGVPSFRFELVEVPLSPVIFPDKSIVHKDMAGPVKDRFYNGWVRSAMPLVAFDAATTELALARLIDATPEIAVWTRLYVNGDRDVSIDVGARSYYPDLIAVDKDNVHYLIEGKADRDLSRQEVTENRVAAQRWQNHVNDSGKFPQWQYLFCSETMIKEANGSWEVLKSFAGEFIN
jgi:type III restriction enzyme